MLLGIIQIAFVLLWIAAGIGRVISDNDKEEKRKQSRYRPYYDDVYGTMHSATTNNQGRLNSASSSTSVSINSSDYKDAYWGMISFSYQMIKQTPIYKKWRHEQFDCQFGKCGICGKPMDRGYTQLDHIKARYDYGTNYSDNLVLVHPKCNGNKGASAGTRPSWIKGNSYSREFDERAWDILQKVHKEYPDKVPDSFIKPPQSIDKRNEAESSLAINQSSSHELIPKESEISANTYPEYSQEQLTLEVSDKQLKTSTITPTNAHKYPPAQCTVIRTHSKKEQEYLDEIRRNLVNMRTDSKWADKNREAWMDATMDKKPCIGKDSFGWH